MVTTEDDYISEGDLIDFMLTCKVEKDYDPVQAYWEFHHPEDETESGWDEWWDYYFDTDTDTETKAIAF